MAGINAALSNMFRSTPRNSVSGKVELPQREDEPLTGGEGLKSDKCELRIEGMTCGACVEVRNLHILPRRFSSDRCPTVNRRDAPIPTWHLFHQSRSACGAGGRRVRPQRLGCGQDRRCESSFLSFLASFWNPPSPTPTPGSPVLAL